MFSTCWFSFSHGISLLVGLFLVSHPWRLCSISHQSHAPSRGQRQFPWSCFSCGDANQLPFLCKRKGWPILVWGQFSVQLPYTAESASSSFFGFLVTVALCNKVLILSLDHLLQLSWECTGVLGSYVVTLDSSSIPELGVPPGVCVVCLC